MRSLLLLAFVLYSSIAYSERLYGVSTHFAQSKTSPAMLSQLIANGSFNSIRDEVYWHDVEKQKGTFELTGKAKQSVDMLNLTSKHGMSPLVVLDYGNKHYDGGDQPYSEEGRQAFGRYCRWVATQLSEKIRLFEIWNEWNHGMGTRPQRKSGSAQDYVKLTRACAEQIRSVRPSAVIIGGAVTNDWGDWPWLTQAINAGLMQHVDAISVHLYSFLVSPPYRQEAFLNDRILRLKSILSKTPKTDVYITEIGWPNHIGQGSTSLINTKAHTTRFILQSLDYPEIKGIWFYELANSGKLEIEKEHNFGLLDHEGYPKPAYCGLNTLLRSIKNKKPSNRTTHNNTSTIQFSSPDKKVLTTAIWRNDWPTLADDFHIEISSDEPFIFDRTDCNDEHEAERVRDRISIDATPILIKHTKPLQINAIKHIKLQN